MCMSKGVHSYCKFSEKLLELLQLGMLEIMPVIEASMKNTLPMRVPIEVELGVGQNWLEAH